MNIKELTEQEINIAALADEIIKQVLSAWFFYISINLLRQLLGN